MYAKTLVVGHLGRDPELRYTPSGIPVCSFSMATTRRWTSADGEQREKTTWFRVTTWRKLAEICAQYLAKGKLVLVEGDVDAGSWTDKEGNAKASLELTATTVRFLGGKPGAPAEAHDEGMTREEHYGDDEIPF
jgi:single-strand DNA-binding protein